MPVISLLTDFGTRDGYVGVMKGVIWKICPDAQIADITHSISPQNIREGAVALLRTTKYFPIGTIHVAVVDPGVGTTRKPLAAEVGGHFFVGPDNGLFSLVFQTAISTGIVPKYYSLDNKLFWLPEISHVFHGRDIFAPVGAHLANGDPLEKMGTLFTDPVFLDNPLPRWQGNSWIGEVIAIDNFGNISTNLGTAHIKAKDRVKVKIGGHSVEGLINTFEDRSAGELVSMIGTEEDLIISVVRGSAAERLSVKIGDPVEVTISGRTD
jgi:S-adenosylmethionine hydrolase